MFKKRPKKAKARHGARNQSVNFVFKKQRLLMIENGKITAGWYQSSQMDRAVNAVASAFGGANPSQPTRVHFVIFNWQ